MNILTPTGYINITNATQGTELRAFEQGTGLPIVNLLQSVELFTLANWNAQLYDHTDSVYYPDEVIGINEETGEIEYSGHYVDTDIYVPDTFDFYVINGSKRRFKYETIWMRRSGVYSAISVKDLQVGDIIFDDNDDDLTVTSVVLSPGTEDDIFYRLTVSGDHSYIADGITYHNASRYWNGTGNWSGGTSVWFTDDTHTTGAATPTNSDDALFTSSSTGTCTVAGSSSCKTLNFTGFSGTFATSSARTIAVYGDVTLSPTMTYTHDGYLSFYSNSQTLTSNTKVLTAKIALSNAANTLILGDDLTLSHSTPFDTFNGTLNANSHKVTLTHANPSFVSTANITFYDLEITTPASITGSFTMCGNIKVLNSLTINGNSTINRYLVQSNTVGTARTITLDGAATATITNTDFIDITGAGSAGNTWFANNTLTGCGDAQGNSGLTFPSPVTSYLKMTGSSKWTDSVWYTQTNGGGSAAPVPLCHDTARIDQNSGDYSFDINIVRIGSLDCSGAINGTFTMNAAGGRSIIGTTYKLASGINYSSATQAHIFANRGTCTLTSDTKTIATLTVQSYGGTLLCGDNCTVSTQCTLASGTFKLNGKTATLPNIILGGAITRTLDLDTGILQINHSTAATRISISSSTNLTVSATTGYIKINGTGTGNCTLTLSGATIPKILIAGTAAYTAIISDGNSTVGWYVDNTPDVVRTLQFKSGLTHNISAFAVSGKNSTYKTIIKTDTAGTYATFNITAADVISNDYLNIRDIYVTQANTFYCGANSTDGTGNNANVIFTAPPGSGSNTGFFMFMGF